MLCPLARANPLPRVPRNPPRAAPPRATGPAPPRFDDPAIREAGAGVESFGVALEDAGGLSTNEVSVVLTKYNISLVLMGSAEPTKMLSRHRNHRRDISLNS
jgi:hypothetical protein